MNITLKRCEVQDRLIFDRLLQLYIYEFTDFVKWDLNEEGWFETTRWDQYFADESTLPFLILVDDALAGFVLVSDEVTLPENLGGHCVKEFFVVRNHRRCGVGKTVATQTFSMFAGKWEVRVMRDNTRAENFWQAVISEFANGNYQKQVGDGTGWQGSIFSFDNNG